MDSVRAPSLHIVLIHVRVCFVFTVERDESDVAPLSQEGNISVGMSMTAKLRPLLPTFKEGPIHTTRGTNSKRKSHSRNGARCSVKTVPHERTPGSQIAPSLSLHFSTLLTVTALPR